MTEGNIIDFARIEEDLLWIRDNFEIVSAGYDPDQATMLVTRLVDEGLPMVEVRPIVRNFSEPMKMIEAEIRDRKLEHGFDPVMEWAMSNVLAKTDAKDNVYPRKERPENKIDPFVALCMAKARAMLENDESISQFLNSPVIGR